MASAQRSGGACLEGTSAQEALFLLKRQVAGIQGAECMEMGTRACPLMPAGQLWAGRSPQPACKLAPLGKGSGSRDSSEPQL